MQKRLNVINKESPTKGTIDAALPMNASEFFEQSSFLKKIKAEIIFLL